MRSILLILLLFLVIDCPDAISQPPHTVLDGRFVLQTNNGSIYGVKVQVKANSSSAQLGSYNFVLEYNQSSLSFPSSPSSGTDYIFHNFNSNPYAASVVPPQLVNGVYKIVVQTVYGTIFDGFGSSVGTSWVDLVTLNFTVLNTSG